MGKTLFQKNVEKVRVQKIKDMTAAGSTSDEVGKEIGMTGSGVRSVLQREREKE